jgi:hypothetical protein
MQNENNKLCKVLGVGYKNESFALIFKMLNKRGNSATQARIPLIKTFVLYLNIS